MTTLGELFDEAFAHLRQAALEPLQDPSEAGTAIAVRDVQRFLVRLRDGSVESSPRRGRPGVVSDAERLLTENIDAALQKVGTAVRLLPAPDHGIDIPVPLRSHLAHAQRLVNAAQDLVTSHRGPDSTPLTPYAHLLTTVPARDYVIHRTADLTRQAARITGMLATPWDPLVNDALLDARSFLDRAAVLGGAASRTADVAIAAFPLALPVEPMVSESDRPAPALLAEDCERLSRAAFETLHGRTDRPMSGSDLHQAARWMAMGRLLTGRALIRTTENHPVPDIAVLAKKGAEALRGASRAWHEVAQGWRRLVDTADPSAHPALPLPSYELVRRGQVVRLPRVIPHPATVIAQSSVVRLGRLLYGEGWLPTGARPDKERPAADILAGSHGEGPLLTAFYRLAATGWQLAVASPAAITRVRAGLVTDEIEFRPPRLDPEQRFYPAHPRQIEQLVRSYTSARRSEETAAVCILRMAEAVNVPVPRALLDAKAHHHITTAVIEWGSTAEGLPPPKVSPSAARARSRTTAQRPTPPVHPVLQRTAPPRSPDVMKRNRAL
ncbi:hypothetical protein [Streptomyces sp. NPDC058486]|uniref:hypothetical protein n=1 Tax=unclassified Streptomyces TaxID=2593676 RepID=UPI003658665A